MQRGKIYQHHGQWTFRYKVATFVNGEKVWKDAYRTLAPLDRYETAAQVERDFDHTLKELRGTHSSKFTAGTTQSVVDFIETTYFIKQKEKLKPSTLFGYRHLYDRHVKPQLNGESMRNFTLPVAQRFLEKIAAATPLASTSLRHIKWFLKAVFDVARMNGAYDPTIINPFEEVHIPKPSNEKKPTRYAGLDNVLDMLDVLPDTAATVVAVAAFAGLRKSEIQGLRWEDLKDGELNVQRSAWRTTSIQTVKTEASRGAVPVISLLAEHLEDHRNGFPSDGFIFTGARLGRPLDLHNLAKRVIRPALAEKNIPWCGWHGFRRGLATNLHTLGVGDTDVQKILRHANVKVTQESYIKVEPKVKKRAMNKLQKALAAKRKRRKHGGRKKRK
jgi:integrase